MQAYRFYHNERPQSQQWMRLHDADGHDLNVAKYHSQAKQKVMALGRSGEK